jgi:Helicase associated domain
MASDNEIPHLDWADQKWEAKFYELKKFKDKYGHCEVPRKMKNLRSLLVWSIRQRTYRRYEPLKYNPERLRKLDSIGFCWDIYDKIFEESFRKLENHYKKYGNSDVRHIEDKKLAVWCNTLRYAKRTGNPRVTLERVEKLNSIEFNWNPPFEEKVEMEWLNKYNELKEFKKEHGRLDVPDSIKKYKALRFWCIRQRAHRHYKKRIYDADKIKMLDKIGFCWEPRNEKFDSCFKRLEKYKKKNGHCNVSLSEDKELSVWCNMLRKGKRDKTGWLSLERIKRLNSLDFSWEPPLHEMAWENQFAQLLVYKKLHGHCDVPENDNKFYRLHRWCVTQRVEMRKKPLQYPKERKKRLDTIGFSWDIKQKWFEQHLAKLKEFKQKNGHCRVLRKDDYILAEWCWKIRRERREGLPSLTKEKIKKISALGFDWDPRGIAK